MARPLFSALSQAYSSEVHNCPDISPSPNQCAVRMSRALIAVGVLIDRDYPGNLCRHGFARGAQDLGAFLRIKWGNRDQGFEAPGNPPVELQGKQGVILFMNIPDYTGQGHIDLWNAASSFTYWGANPIWFWELR